MGDSDITPKLQGVGLDADYWGKVFRDELGVTSAEALRYVGRESYPKLEKYVKGGRDWQKNALRDLLNMDEGKPFREQREKERKNLEERHEKMMKIQKKLKDERSKSRDRNAESIKMLEKDACAVLQVPSNAWIPQSKPLTEVIDHVDRLVDGIGGQLKCRHDLPDDAAVLIHASGGRAMKGIVWGKSLEDQLSVYVDLLKVPNSVQLLGPSEPQKSITEQFSSQLQEDTFAKAVDVFGYNLASEYSEMFFEIVSVDAKGAIGGRTTEERNREQHKKEEYASTMKYSSIPLASFAFTDSQLQLSDDALKDLEQIEGVIVTFTPKSPDVQQACERFFRKFGSHANRGPLHFGGIYRLKCSTKEFSSSHKSDVKKIQSFAVNAEVNITVVVGTGVSSDVDIKSVTSGYKGANKNSIVSQSHLTLNKIGGPPEAATLCEWTTGLTASNSTWSVIDRGTNFVPVWEIVKMNHRNQFKNVRELAETLKEAWEKMTGKRAEPEVHSTSYTKADVLKKVSGWNANKDDSLKNLEEKLRYLIEVKEELIKVSMNPRTWPRTYLKEDPLKQFLKSVVDQQQHSPSRNEYVKLLMKQLVEKADLEAMKLDAAMEFTSFPHKSISLWLYGPTTKQQSQLPSEYYSNDFQAFQEYLETEVENLKEATAWSVPTFNTSSSSTQHSYISAPTSAVARTISSFERSLQKYGQRYERLFLLTLIFPFKYGSSYQPVILKQLSVSDLQFLNKVIQTTCDEFFKHANKDLTKTQAFLFQLAIDLLLNETQIDVDECRVLNHLQFLEGSIGEELEPPLVTIFTKYPLGVLGNVNLEELQNELCTLMSSNHELQETGPSLMNVLEDVKKTLEDGVTVQSSEPLVLHTAGVDRAHSSPSAVRDSRNTTLAQGSTPEVAHLFSLLEMMKFFPQKLTLHDAICVRKETLAGTKCADPTRVYIFLLQRIMRYDYQCRANLLCQSNSIPETPAQSDELFGDSSEDELFYDTFQEQNIQSQQSIEVHPMDIFLVLLHCADDFLRQDLLTRLVDCQLSIPLILPDPFTQQLTFPLWAMRSIVKEWKNADGEIHEDPLVSYSAPIVSFVRFHKQQKSKSKLMNNVISNSNHDHFFHRDCEGGKFNNVLGNGMVDVCWYLPSGKPDDLFPDLVTFVNLHGNVLDYPQQTGFLSKVSFMTFVLFNEEDLNDESTKVLEQLSTAPGGIVMLLCGSGNKDKLKLLAKSIPKEKRQGLNLMQSAKNADTMKKEIRKKINATLKKLSPTTSETTKKLEECIEIASKHEILADECKEEILEAKRLAHTVQEMLTTYTDPDVSVKEKMLPLQGECLWQKWAAQDKEEHRQVNRGEKKFEEYSSRKQREKKQIRTRQLHHVQHLSPLMQLFIKTLLSAPRRVRNYFIQCLKHYLNNRSQKATSSWQKHYQEMRSQQLALQRERKPNKRVLKDMEVLLKRIANASLGLEHLLRELGQLYEAVQESPHKDKEDYFRLPKVTAELLIDGYPLELMDGDAAHVPTKWVSAVIQETANLLNDPRLFVLSVLGIQNTGKSTLINTTFGLHFNISDGRCTRGAFMQLVPVCDELKHETKCDYMLVVDTEGLRAPELDFQKTHQHDNELATFVIGLANSTIVNIYGVAQGDMKDILQTSVHAFIRMKTVRIHNHFNPSCQFVHQNVPAVRASDKSGRGQANFRDELDKMTVAAAKEEKRGGDIEYFTDIIQFDEERDVHRFPGLWKGTPPMAAVNPGYSEKSLSLKTHLVERMKESKGLLKLSDTHKQLEDLWNALLHETFVFSFRNTLELSIYTALDTKCIQWSGKFRSEMMEWELTASSRIKNTGPDQMKALKHELLEYELPTKVADIHKELHEREICPYFEESDQRDMLAQWKSEATSRLDRLERKLQDQAKDFCLELMSSSQARETLQKKYAGYRKQLNEKVKVLAEELRARVLAEEDTDVEDRLKTTFDTQWTDWIQDLATVYREDIDVELSIEQSLIGLYRQDEQTIRRKLESRPLSEWGKSLKLSLNEEHVNLKVKEPKRYRQVMRRAITNPANVTVLSNPKLRKHAEANIKAIFDETEEYLRSKENGNFRTSFTDQLLENIKAVIDKDCHTELEYTKQYYLDVSLTACGYAARKFKELRETFLRKNDPIVCMEMERKDSMFLYFKNQYFQTANEKRAACAFCDELVRPIREVVQESLPNIVLRDMRMMPHLANKSTLKASILVDLGEDLQKKGKLDDYFLHLTDVAKSYGKWLKRYTTEYCQTQRSGSHSQLVVLAIQKMKALVRAVGQQVEEVAEELKTVKYENDTKVSQWLTNICSKLASTLEVTVFRHCVELGGVSTLKNIQNFTDEIQKGLQTLQSNLQEKFECYTLNDLEKQPHDLLFDMLCGCTEQCPFCKEQCDITNSDHDVNHSAQQHRPECLSGSSWGETSEMIIEVCNTSVTSSYYYSNEGTGYKWFPYKRYQEMYPRWSIPVDLGAESSLYWKWFVGKYSKEIAKHYGIKVGKIPSSWKTCTWEEAKAEVKKTYMV